MTVLDGIHVARLDLSGHERTRRRWRAKVLPVRVNNTTFYRVLATLVSALTHPLRCAGGLFQLQLAVRIYLEYSTPLHVRVLKSRHNSHRML